MHIYCVAEIFINHKGDINICNDLIDFEKSLVLGGIKLKKMFINSPVSNY